MLRLLLIVMAGAACAPGGARSSDSRPAPELTVFAAASLTDVLQEIGRGYEATTGEKVFFNFGASSDLARQIRAGAPADAFFSADLARVEELEGEGLIAPGQRRDLLSNVLAVVVPAQSPAELRGPEDLRKIERIALADPEAVPAGQYARRYLSSRGLWETLRGKVLPALDVRAALAMVEAGHAQAGIVYRTDAALSKRVRVAFVVPREEGPPIVYALAPLAASGERAAPLILHLVSPDALAAYERHGFLVLARR